MIVVLQMVRDLRHGHSFCAKQTNSLEKQYLKPKNKLNENKGTEVPLPYFHQLPLLSLCL